MNPHLAIVSIVAGERILGGKRTTIAAITIQLPDFTETALRQQAQAAGIPVEQFVTDVLQAQVDVRALLHQISGSVGEKFARSGMSERELGQQLELKDHAARGAPYDE